MKATVTELNNKNSYPGLYKSITSDIIFLMVAPKRGTVVSGTGPYKLGTYAEDWTKNLTPFIGTVTLEN